MEDLKIGDSVVIVGAGAIIKQGEIAEITAFNQNLNYPYQLVTGNGLERRTESFMRFQLKRTQEWAGELGMENVSYCGKCDYQQPNCACPKRVDKNYGPKGGLEQEIVTFPKEGAGTVLKELSKKRREGMTPSELLEEILKPQGIKLDQNKPDMSLLSSNAINKLAQVLSFGAKKYQSHNWRLGIAWSRIIAGVLRHLFSYLGGERKDPETGLSHLAHAMCGIMFLLEYEDTRQEFDDLYKETK